MHVGLSDGRRTGLLAPPRCSPPAITTPRLSSKVLLIPANSRLDYSPPYRQQGEHHQRVREHSQPTDSGSPPETLRELR